MNARILPCVLGALAFALAPAGTAHARSHPESPLEVPADRSAVTARLVAALKRLSTWCNQEELFRRRDAALRAILSFEPDHAEARRFLKYRREKDGSWTRPHPYKEPKDFRTSKLPEHRKLCAELLRGLDQAVLGMLERDPAFESDRARRPYLDALLALDPDHLGVHERLSEVRAVEGGGWILEESASARIRRAELAALAPRILESVPRPAPIVPSDAEVDLADAWRKGYASARLRILATDSGDAAGDCLRIAEATISMFDLALKRAPCAGGPRFTIYLLWNAAEKERFLTRHPAVGPERAAELSRYDSFWVLDRPELVVCAHALDLQIDHVVRQTIARELIDHFRLLPDSGVLHAGITAYLASLVRSSRPGATSGPAQVLAVDSRARDRIDVRGISRKDAARLRRSESETSRDLASYLLEGWPARTADLLERAGSGIELEPAMQASLGFGLATVEERYARWAAETR